MRIIIDLQGAQSLESRERGIGRYSLAITKALARRSAGHDLVLALNGAFPETIEPLRAEFQELVPQRNIRVWRAPGPVAHVESSNDRRREIAELAYEAFLANEKPDFILVTSLFEGLSDDAVTSIHRLPHGVPVAVVHYDLIRYLNPVPYLENPVVERWYTEKLEHLKRSDLCLAISEASRQDLVTHLGFPEDRTVNISADADERFQQKVMSPEQERAIRQRYGIGKPFVMYTGGIDYRKNVEGLVRAYASLHEAIRKDHQLVIVCSVQAASRQAIEELALAQRLGPDEIVLTGFVPDEDLVDLYNLCKLFVFPSWQEGFGLPALEAMRCGAPVIGSNTSSLPEVIGREDALFDPRSDQSMADALERGLTDEAYRQALMRHASEQARRFSWDESAQRCLDAMEHWRNTAPGGANPAVTENRRRRLAYISPLPPVRSGIADYSADLLPELSEHYDVEVIVDQAEAVTDPWIRENCPIRSPQWLIDHAGQYERVLYHFGNSPFHEHMFALLEKVPGVVVLHDFYLSAVQAYRELNGRAPGAWTRALHAGHGYRSVRERFDAPDSDEVTWRYPANLPVLQRAIGIVVHNDYCRALAEQWYGPGASNEWAVVPLLRTDARHRDRAAARAELGFDDDDVLICSFGMLGPTKLSDRLVRAWLTSPLRDCRTAHLVFVGENHGGDYGRALLRSIESSGAGERIKITGWADPETFHRYLAAADIGVQLRALSRGETSAAVLDCMNYGLPTIINAHGSLADIDPAAVWMLPDQFDDAQLVEALNTLAMNPEERKRLGARATEVVREHHAPARCAEGYAAAIEDFYRKARAGLPGLLAEIATLAPPMEEMTSLASCLALDFPPAPRRAQLLVDISELVQRDAKSGIQRVVRAILKEWIENPPEGFQVEPVYATAESTGYRYARRFMSEFLRVPSDWASDDPAEAWPGDVFVGLDLQMNIVPLQRTYLKEWHSRGVGVWFVVYDLLPILMSRFFTSGLADVQRNWLQIASEFDGLACISNAVADEVREWLTVHGAPRERPLAIEWFHLGSDVEASAPTRGVPADAGATLEALASRPTFLMVGTVEPRKGHEHVLDAFEHLWATNVDVNLVIVGKQGWLVDDLVPRLRTHEEAGRRMFWLESVSDEYLDLIYAASTCLIAASYGEGFGLPLIEAAQHELPIIARDIPVFREIAGDHAFFFSASTAEGLARAIQEWLQLYEAGMHPISDGMPRLSWKDSACQLKEVILGQKGSRRT